MISGMQNLSTLDLAVMEVPLCGQLFVEHRHILLPRSFEGTLTTLSWSMCGALELLFMRCLQLSCPSRDRTFSNEKRTFWLADIAPNHPSPPKPKNY